MALVFEEYSNPALDLGQWFPYQAGASCRVRRMPSDEATAIEATFLDKPEEPATPAAEGAPRPRSATTNFVDLARAKAVRVWTDCKGFAVAPQDDAEAAFYMLQLKRPVQVGDTVELDGKLTEDIKDRILTRHVTLVFWLNGRMNDQERRYRADEKLLLKNSSPGSASEASSQASPPSDARLAESPAA